MIDPAARKQQLEHAIAMWQETADKLPDSPRKDGILAGIARDQAELEVVTASVGDTPTILDEATQLAAQEKRRVLVVAEAKRILKEDPEFPDDELAVAGIAQAPEGEKESATEAKSVTPSRG
jgi:hypothetical protein